MCKLIIDRGNFSDFTSVSNVFIDEYMPVANGEFIKIYLYLLRLVNGGDSDLSHGLSTENIADRFNMLESDVMRALNYWCNQGLLSLSFNEKKELSAIKMESAFKNRYYVNDIVNTNSADNTKVLASVVGEVSATPVPEALGVIVPPKHKYTAKEISTYSGDDRLTDLTFLAQTYLGKTLSPADINSILYMLDGLGFGTDFIEYIMEICISSGHKTLSYIEKKAVEYARKGISSIEDAKTYDKLKTSIYQSIYKIFGLEPKIPVKKEMDYIVKWTNDYNFRDEIILEACNRTMEYTHTGSFQYTDTILTNWFNLNATSMEEIAKLDNHHSEEINRSFKPKTVSRPKKAKNFDQRTYDYNSLEKQLRENLNKKMEKIHSENQ